MAVVVVAMGAVAVLGPAPSGAATVQVEVLDHAFSLPTVTVQVGDTVTWVQTSALPHTVTADDGSFDSSPGCLPECLGPGSTFSHTFTTPGTYAYHCTIHGAPGGVGMAGVVVVEAGADPAPSPGPEARGTQPGQGGGGPGSSTPTTTAPRGLAPQAGGLTYTG